MSNLEPAFPVAVPEAKEPAELAATGAVLDQDKLEPSEAKAVRAIEEFIANPKAELPEAFRGIADPKRVAMLIALSVTPIMGAACAAVGVTPRTLYNWKADPTFRPAYDVARKMGIKVAEDEAWKRATDGTTEDVYGSLGMNQGTGVVGQRRVKSDTMLIFMLKAAVPEKYRERFEHTGAGGGPIEFAHLTTEELLARHKELVDIAPPQALEGELLADSE